MRFWKLRRVVVSFSNPKLTTLPNFEFLLYKNYHSKIMTIIHCHFCSVPIHLILELVAGEIE